MGFVPATVDYASRQVDVELLQTIPQPVAEQQVYLGTVGRTPKIVTGIEKVVQRYASLLLTTQGDVRFDAQAGGTMIRAVTQGLVSDAGYLTHLFNVVSLNTVRLMRRDDNDERFGIPPNDERIVDAWLTNVTVDYDTLTANLTVLISTVAGDAFTYIIPVSTAR
jgi:hypothetical protein